jgi:hypothetical protein
MESVTAAEHTAGRLEAAKLERLSAEFEATGYVILANVVPDHEVPTPMVSDSLLTKLLCGVWLRAE